MLEDMFKARKTELDLLSRQAGYRMEYARISRVERLESALRSARARLSWPGQSTPVKA